jgi:hypothetical protein
MRFGNGVSVYEIDRCFRSVKKALLTIQQGIMRTMSNIGGAGRKIPDSLRETTNR